MTPYDADYFNQPRQDIADLIDPDGFKVVLDVGCGAGGLGRGLQEKGRIRIVGIDSDFKALRVAAGHYDSVVAADIESLDLTGWPVEFDVIVCADVLEHLRDPWSVLKRLRKVLKPDGYLVASIPNFRNVGVVAELLSGTFDYQDHGILDRTHLRFFTRQTARAMFRQSGYWLESVEAVMSDDGEAIVGLWETVQMRQRIADIVKLMVGSAFTPQAADLRDLLVLRYLVKARPGAASGSP